VKKHILIATLLFAGAISAAAAPAPVPAPLKHAAAKPDPAYGAYLSSEGPLSVPALHKRPAHTPGKLSDRMHAMTSGNTYTYLRCYYRLSNDLRDPSTDYVWGLDPSSGGYFHVNGFWYSGSVFAWENMFYSDTSQDALQSACQYTLAQNGIQSPVAMVFGANNDLSFNYTIWTNDSATQGSQINKIVAFGDSLSDNQNMYNASDWKLPNSSSWYIGHFSNGNVWTEYLARNLHLPMYDWALGGAGVNTNDIVIPGLVQQVQSWSQYMQSAPAYNPQNTLFTLLIGGNDLVNYSVPVPQIVLGVQQALNTLISRGARNILVLKLPDVSNAPVFQYRTDSASIAAQVVDYNNQLAQLVGNLRGQYGASLNLQLFDTYTVFNALLTNPSAYGVGNTTQSCLDINSTSTFNYTESHSTRSNCVDPNTFVFWDTLHPTTHTHQILANAVTTFVQQQFGALPAASLQH